MAELIMTIALLCQVTSTARFYKPEYIDKYQLNCQKYYIRCVQTVSASNVIRTTNSLDSCVLNKDIK